MVTKLLLKIAKAVLNEVLGEIARQVDVLQDQIRQPIQNMAQEVTGGVWIGNGADAFVNELTGLFIPETEGITESCNVIGNNITRATATMEQADAQARSLVENMAGIFQGIY